MLNLIPILMDSPCRVRNTIPETCVSSALAGEGVEGSLPNEVSAPYLPHWTSGQAPESPGAG